MIADPIDEEMQALHTDGQTAAEAIRPSLAHPIGPCNSPHTEQRRGPRVYVAGPLGGLFPYYGQHHLRRGIPSFSQQDWRTAPCPYHRGSDRAKSSRPRSSFGSLGTTEGCVRQVTFLGSSRSGTPHMSDAAIKHQLE